MERALKTRSLAAIFLALAPLVAQAAPDERMVARYGLSETEFRAANDELTASGLRLADLTVAEVEGRRVIGAIWGETATGEPAATPERRKLLQSLVYLRQGREELEALVKAKKAQKSELDTVDAYVVEGRNWYAAVFSPPGENPMHTVVPFQSRDQTTALRQEAVEHGFDFYRMDIAPEGEGRIYFPVFVRRESPDQLTGYGASDAKEFRVGMTERKGIFPLSISAFPRADGKPQYYALLDESAERELLLDLPLEEFRAKLQPAVADGALVLDIDSFVVDGEVHYSAIYLAHSP